MPRKPKAANAAEIIKEPYVAPVLTPLYHHLWKAAESTQDDNDHTNEVSASGVDDCRLKNWFRVKEFPRDNRIPPESLKKMESGRAIEPFWRDVYERAGFEVVSPLDRIEPIGNLRGGGGGDGGLIVRTPEAAATVGEPIGSRGLLELKDLGIWTYFDVINKGWTEGAPQYIVQAQVYMEGYDWDWAVLHAGQADSSATKTWWTRMWKRDPKDLPAFWAEKLVRDSRTFAWANARAGEINWFTDNSATPPMALRDFDVHDKLQWGQTKKGFPCAYCGWSKTCANLG